MSTPRERAASAPRERAPSAPGRLEVDALGLLCPLPILRAEQALRREKGAAILELWSDDPAIEADLPRWCEGQGHVLESLAPSVHPSGRRAWLGVVRRAQDRTAPGR